MNSKEITEKIRSFALSDAGFDLVGFSSASLPELHENAITQWVENGFAGTMEYMARDSQRRAHPEKTLPGARTVISLAVNYFHPEDPKPEFPAGKVAKYAYGADYHKIIEKKLKTLAAFIKKEAGPDAEIKSYVDTGPVLEKAFAQQSGLGFFGKNTNIITRDFGSWVFLASLITNLELEVDPPHLGGCGSCRICIDACPTGALLGNYEMDARKCISYLTIEDKTGVGETVRESPQQKQIGEWVFGCDICQDVCPYNFRAKITRHKELYPEKKAGTWIDLRKVASIKDDVEFREFFQGSPVKRPKLAGVLRNVRLAARNQNCELGEIKVR